MADLAEIEWGDGVTPSLLAIVGDLGLVAQECPLPVHQGELSPSSRVARVCGLGVTTVFLSAQDDVVARVSERVGFTRVATACILAVGR